MNKFDGLVEITEMQVRKEMQEKIAVIQDMLDTDKKYRNKKN